MEDKDLFIPFSPALLLPLPSYCSPPFPRVLSDRKVRCSGEKKAVPCLLDPKFGGRRQFGLATRMSQWPLRTSTDYPSCFFSRASCATAAIDTSVAPPTARGDPEKPVLGRTMFGSGRSTHGVMHSYISQRLFCCDCLQAEPIALSPDWRTLSDRLGGFSASDSHIGMTVYSTDYQSTEYCYCDIFLFRLNLYGEVHRE